MHVLSHVAGSVGRSRGDCTTHTTNSIVPCEGPSCEWPRSDLRPDRASVRFPCCSTLAPSSCSLPHWAIRRSHHDVSKSEPRSAHQPLELSRPIAHYRIIQRETAARNLRRRRSRHKPAGEIARWPHPARLSGKPFAIVSECQYHSAYRNHTGFSNSLGTSTGAQEGTE